MASNKTLFLQIRVQITIVPHFFARQHGKYLHQHGGVQHVQQNNNATHHLVFGRIPSIRSCCPGAWSFAATFVHIDFDFVETTRTTFARQSRASAFRITVPKQHRDHQARHWQRGKQHHFPIKRVRGLKFRQFAIRPQHVLARGRDGRLHGKQRFHRRRPLQNGETSKHK